MTTTNGTLAVQVAVLVNMLMCVLRITAFFIHLLIMIRRVTVLDLRLKIDLRAMPLLLFWVACHFLSYYVLDSAEPSSAIYLPHDTDNGITTYSNLFASLPKTGTALQDAPERVRTITFLWMSLMKRRSSFSRS